MTSAQTMPADMNWFAVLAHHAVRTPDKAITVFEGETTTYGEMAGRATALAGGLAERGIGRGDVVALLSYNCPEFLETIFAANYLGAIAMPINWRLAATGGAVHPRALGSRVPSCATSLSSIWPTRRPRGSSTGLVRACLSPGGGGRDGQPWPICVPTGTGSPVSRRRPTTSTA